MILILIILIFSLLIRKNTNNLEIENFSNLNTQTDIIHNNYFTFLKNDTLKKQSIRNLLF